MSKNQRSEAVKGGWVTRSAKSGRFIEVRSASGSSKSTSKTVNVVKGASSKRKDALKRLVNR